MISLMKSFKDNYEDWRTGAHTVVDKWSFMESPGLISGIVIAYLVFVLKLGPDYMKNRKPMDLKNTLVAYNGFQIVFSLFLVYKISYADIPVSKLFSGSCPFKTNMTESRLIFLEGTWWYLMAKITELWDTVFFVLRKKMNQVTFLHVYHHASMAFFTWCFLKYNPSEHVSVCGLVNSTVHVVMYFYYMVAALGPQYQKYIWWKKYMTVMQLTQFCIILFYMFVAIFSNCGFPRSVTYFFIGNVTLFLYLFSDFYRQSYNKAAKAKLANANSNNTNVEPVEEKVIYKQFPTDDEVYSNISKDVVMLNESTKLRKRQ